MQKRWLLPIFIAFLGAILLFAFGLQVAFYESEREVRVVVATEDKESSLKLGSVVSTLVEITNFSYFQKSIAASGFSSASKLLSSNSLEELREKWNCVVKICRVSDAYVVRVRTRSSDGQVAKQLASVIAQNMALETSKKFGPSYYLIVDEPRLVANWANEIAWLVLILGVIMILISGSISINFLRVQRITKGKTKPMVSPNLIAQRLQPTKEDPRHLLQKFLDENQIK